ncbi:hypothetical protein ACF067_15650, partial [Streptomyces albidoflavus]
ALPDLVGALLTTLLENAGGGRELAVLVPATHTRSREQRHHVRHSTLAQHSPRRINITTRLSNSNGHTLTN